MTRMIFVLSLLISCKSSVPLTSTSTANLGVGSWNITLAAGANLLDGDDVGGRNQRSWFRMRPNASGSSISGLKISANFADSNAVTNLDAYFVYITNEDPSLPITILHEDTAGGADSTNWINLWTNDDVVLEPGDTILLSSEVELTNDENGNTIITRRGWHQIVDRSAAGVRVGAETQPSRTIGTTWQPNTVRPTMVVVTLTATCSLTLIGGQAGRVDVLVGPTNPPTRVVGSVPCQHTGAVVVGVDSTVTTGGTISWIVKPGDRVLVQSTDTVGTPSYTLAVTEQTL